MKRAIMAVLTYSIAGRGFYKVFFDNANIYGFLILSVGLAGGLYDIFYQKLKATLVFPCVCDGVGKSHFCFGISVSNRSGLQLTEFQSKESFESGRR